jgi:Domain of unknown function (DUF4388)
MQGSINQHSGIQLADLLQMLSSGNLSGILEISENRTAGVIEFHKGDLGRINFGNLSGVKALARLLLVPELNFSFHAGSSSEHADPYKSATELLMEAALLADTIVPTSRSLTPSYFTIKNRSVLNSQSKEEAQEIMAEFDFLFHGANSIGSSLYLGETLKIIIKEEYAYLAFHKLAEDHVIGYQSLKPCTLTEAFDLL